MSMHDCGNFNIYLQFAYAFYNVTCVSLFVSREVSMRNSLLGKVSIEINFRSICVMPKALNRDMISA